MLQNSVEFSESIFILCYVLNNTFNTSEMELVLFVRNYDILKIKLTKQKPIANG